MSNVIGRVPAAVHRHFNPISPTDAPSSIELDTLTSSSKYNGHLDSSRSEIPGEAEEGGPGTPNPEVVSRITQRTSSPPINRFRLATYCVINICNGLNDSAPGAIIPYLEKDYNIGYAVVSLIFVANAIGFISAAFITDLIHSHYGRTKTTLIGEGLRAIAYINVLCHPPYPLVTISSFLLGLGAAINLALGNTWCANLGDSATSLSLYHGAYGIGGTIGPLIATSMVSRGLSWSTFYALPMGLTVANMPFAAWCFWTFEEEMGIPLLTALERTVSRRAAVLAGEPTKLQSLKIALGNKVTVLGALFIFAYQGAEVAISGWVISFLITYRKGNPAEVGYVTAGFWGGITLGRFLLVHPAYRVGEKLFTYIVVALSAVFQLIVWLVPNVVGNAVAVSIVGLLLGPVYPCSTRVLTRLLDRKFQVTSLGIVSALGSSGGAIAPFTTGLLAQSFGTWVLFPVSIALFVCMEGCWFGLPKIRKRGE